jgi:CoA:oxalate CoA-transferase
MGKPELVHDPRFRDARVRRDNNDEIKMLIEEWLIGFAGREGPLRVLEQHRVPCAPVLTLNEAMAEPHLRERQTIRRVEDPELGSFDIPGLPVKFSRWADRTHVRADRLGEHNAEILRELAGLSNAQIAELYAEKVLVRDPSLESESLA